MESFGQAIKAHMELKERNSRLEGEMPLDSYRAEHDLVDDAPFGLEADGQQVDASSETEQNARPLAEPDTGLPMPEELWVGTRGFDWGD
jgi:hypothetical protein